MLWRLPRSIRSLLISNQRKCLSTTTTSPLRILFCGSDDFSIASLRALLDEKEANQKLIESIEVVHKKGKRSGRGLKLIKDGIRSRANNETP
jgi:methionyl-tRNA formyltransferase